MKDNAVINDNAIDHYRSKFDWAGGKGLKVDYTGEQETLSSRQGKGKDRKKEEALLSSTTWVIPRKRIMAA